MHHRSTSVLALVAAALLAGCNAADVSGLGGADPPPAPADAPIRTDSAVYHLRTTSEAHELTLALTYANPTGGPVYIPACHSPYPPVLQKWVDERWETVYDPPVLRCLGAPVVIGAGEEYEYTYRVYASRRPNTYPRLEVDEIPGSYRLLWHLLGTWDRYGPEPGLGSPLPLEQRVSNTFRIES